MQHKFDGRDDLYLSDEHTTYLANLKCPLSHCLFEHVLVQKQFQSCRLLAAKSKSGICYGTLDFRSRLNRDYSQFDLN